MPYEIIAFLVGLGIIAFLKYGKGSLSGLTHLWHGSEKSGSDEKPSLLSSISSFKATLIKNTPGKALESKRWWWYITLVVVAIILVYVTPDAYKDYRFAIGGWFILLGLHLIVWPFFTEKTSLTTKVVMTAFMLFFINAAVLPNATRVEVKRFQDAKNAFDEGYGKAPAVQSVEQSIQAVYQLEITSVQLTIPVDETVFVAPPQGYRLSSALCPAENVMEITNGRDNERHRQIDCAGQITLDEAELYGKSFAFFQKPGGIQPSTVVVRWKKIV